MADPGTDPGRGGGGTPQQNAVYARARNLDRLGPHMFLQYHLVRNLEVETTKTQLSDPVSGQCPPKPIQPA